MLRSHRWLVWLAAVTAALVNALPTLRDLAHLRTLPPTWISEDLDTALIHDGLVRAPHFTDTLKWWVGPWVAAPVVPFYRPLSSLLFWLEWKAFGGAEWLYLFPTILAHVLATVLFAELAVRLAERYRVPVPALVGIVAACSFTGLVELMGLRYPTVLPIFRLWKNQPDSCATMCACLSLMAYLRSAHEPRSILACIGWYLAACGFKEVAVPLVALPVALEGAALLRRDVPAWRRVGLLLGCAGVFILFRSAVLHGTGYTYGSNRAWLSRSLTHGLGPLGALMLRQWLGLAVVCWCALLFFLTRHLQRRQQGRPRIWLPVGMAVLAVLGAGAVGMAWEQLNPAGQGGALSMQERWLIGMFDVLASNELTWMAQILVLAGSVWLVWRRDRWLLLFCLAWVELLLLPLLFSPGPPHRYYLPEAGFSLLLGLATAELWGRVAAWWRGRARKPAATIEAA